MKTKIMFKYLGREVDVALSEFQDGNELVKIIPHDVLHDLIYNSEEASKNNIQAHYTPVVTEPGHYAFICSINDKNGRRVESIGESLAATLTTEISRNYPALMAAKRAFDDASIKFLMCDGKVYSDQQIDICGLQQGYPDMPDTCGDATESHSDTVTGDVSDDVSEGIPDGDFETTSYNAGGDISDDIEREPDPTPTPAPATTKKETEKKQSAKQDATKKDSAESETAGDEFDTTIIVCGSMKREGLSVRACYQKKPEAIEWIVNNLPAKNETFTSQKEVCQRFLEHIKNGGQ